MSAGLLNYRINVRMFRARTDRSAQQGTLASVIPPAWSRSIRCLVLLDRMLTCSSDKVKTDHWQACWPDLCRKEAESREAIRNAVGRRSSGKYQV